jgi:M6 family metalloprotease-like protein
MPYEGELFTVANPDGTEIQLRGWGNQFGAVFETLDGYTVVKDPESGYFNYADLSADRSDLVSTGVTVGAADPQTLGVPSHARIRRSAAKARAIQTRAAEGPPPRWEVRRALRRAAHAQADRAVGPEGAPPPGPTVGTYVGLCILIDFPDVAATISQSEVDNYCNQIGYSGFGNNGSVRDYFFEVSGQKLTYTNEVTNYYRAQHNRSYYTDPAIPYGTRAKELIREALDSLVADGFDFNPLSNDSGGYIYALNIFYAGPTVNAWSEGLWPHSWNLGTPYNIGTKKFFDYQFTSMGAELTLGTFCHENGHMICDFPDLYDYGYESRGAGRFCLMASSANKKNPIHVGAYLKNAAGWADSVTPISPGTTVSVVADQNDFHLHEKNSTEYFIIENRQQTGRDAGIPDAGLAIWHIDETASNNNEQMTAAMHYECALEQADGDFDLENGANSGDGADLFAAPAAADFDQSSTPNSNWWDGSSSGLDISSVSAPGPTMTFNVGGSPPPSVSAGLDPGALLLLLG